MADLRRRVPMRPIYRGIFITFLAAYIALAFGVAWSRVVAQTKTKASKTQTQGKVDINTAREKDLEQLPGVGPATAKKIVAGRPYSAISDLSKAGVPAKTIQEITPLVTVGGVPVSGQEEEPKTGKTRSSSAAPDRNPGTTANPAPQPAPSGKGMVWVNLDSGVYHREGSQWYGKTKNGKYMPEADAVKAGYRPAKNEKVQQ